MLIYLGSVDTNKSPVKAAVSKIHVHPTFVMNCTNVCNAMQDDIAVFELAEPLQFTDIIRPICLPTEYKEVYGKTGFIAGWGTHDGMKLDQGLGPDRLWKKYRTKRLSGRPLHALRRVVSV